MKNRIVTSICRLRICVMRRKVHTCGTTTSTYSKVLLVRRTTKSKILHGQMTRDESQ